MSQVRAVVERQLAPSVRRVHRKPRVALKRGRKRVKTIIMARRSVCDIPRCRGVIQSIRICLVVPNRRIALVRMDMASQDQINRVFDEKWLKRLSTLFTHVARGARYTNVPRPVARCTNNQHFYCKRGEGAYPPTTTHGVFFLSTEAKSACSQFT